ncbi:hypothetical protein, partial [Paenibacillus macerans]|uniref:hypothetical protein n=1 Tax=Paenibacillus macerans TaxID=44252 RepID=UPI003D2A0E4B
MGQDTRKNEKTVILLQPEIRLQQRLYRSSISIRLGYSRKGLVRLACDQLAVRDCRNRHTHL